MSIHHRGVRLSDPSTFTRAAPASGWVSRSTYNRALQRKHDRDFERAERALVRPDRRVKGMGMKRAERVVGEATLRLIRDDRDASGRSKYPYVRSDRAPKTLTRKYVKPRTVRYADRKAA